MNTSINTLIPERLTSVREKLHLSKAEAARRIGLTPASYVRYEGGDRRPSPQVLQSIAEKLETSVAFLSGESDDMSPDSIYINRHSEPLLFELTKTVQGSDDATLHRLLNYYHRFKDNE